MMLGTRLGSLLLGPALLLAACGGQGALPMAPDGDLPQFLVAAPPRVREAYRFAIANPHELEKHPCFCGCNKMGHTSNRSCFIRDIAGSGVITFDDHAAGCGICVDIAQDVMRLKGEGKPAPAIRAYIDAQYGAFGPTTDTPIPTE